MCDWDTASFLIFSDNVFAPLIYYSHLAPAVISLLLGALVFLNDYRRVENRILFLITISFSVWVLFDLVLWASEKSDFIMFFWSALAPIELFFYASCFYLVAVFANQGKDVSITKKLVLFAAFLPVFALGHTAQNLLGYDLTNCDREAIEGPIWQYIYLVELFITGWTLIVGLSGYAKVTDAIRRKQIFWVTLGTVLLIFAFTAGNILITYFLEVDWRYEQYKLFGMPVFVAFIAYGIIKLKAFNAKLLTAHALV